jgi:hypothetical protein
MSINATWKSSGEKYNSKIDPTPYVLLYFQALLVIYAIVFLLLLVEKLVVRRPA